MRVLVMRRLTKRQRDTLTKAAKHKDGNVVGAHHRTLSALASHRMVMVYAHNHGPLWRITDEGRAEIGDRAAAERLALAYLAQDEYEIKG